MSIDHRLLEFIHYVLQIDSPIIAIKLRAQTLTNVYNSANPRIYIKSRVFKYLVPPPVMPYERRPIFIPSSKTPDQPMMR